MMRRRFYREGSRRVRTAFLWLPRTIDYEERWLERATWEEEYLERNPGYFKGVRWIDDVDTAQKEGGDA